MTNRSIKRLLATLICAMIIVVGIAAVPTWHKLTYKPSDELLHLRSIEKSLGLPKPSSRSEQDAGCTVDSKGARHFLRYVLVYYSSLSDAQHARSTLERAGGWTAEEPIELFENDMQYLFTNNTQNAKASLEIDKRSTDRLPHALFIEPYSTEERDRCP